MTDEQRPQIPVWAIAGVIGLLVLFFIFQLFAPTLGHSHPPQVTIERNNTHPEYITIIWEAGTDSGFVGGFSVAVDNESNTTKYYRVPLMHDIIASIHHPNATCVDVKAYDKAVYTYRPIGWNCT